MPRDPNPDDIFNAGPDHTLKVLMESYGLTLKQAQAYAAKLQGGGSIPGSEPIQGEAMQGLADQELRRISRVNYYADVSRRYYSGKPVTEPELNYLNAVNARQHDLAKQQAQQQAQTALDEQGAHQSYGVSTEPNNSTMDPVVRETARMQNMTDWAKQAGANPELGKNWTYDGFTMRLRPPSPNPGMTATPIERNPGMTVTPIESDSPVSKMDPATKDKLIAALLAKGTR